MPSANRAVEMLSRTVEQKRVGKVGDRAVGHPGTAPVATIIIRDMANYTRRRRSSSRPRVNQEHDTELTRPPKSAWSGFLSQERARTDAYCVGVSVRDNGPGSVYLFPDSLAALVSILLNTWPRARFKLGLNPSRQPSRAFIRQDFQDIDISVVCSRVYQQWCLGLSTCQAGDLLIYSAGPRQPSSQYGMGRNRLW